jgi:hypothetical protein
MGRYRIVTPRAIAARSSAESNLTRLVGALGSTRGYAIS